MAARPWRASPVTSLPSILLDLMMPEMDDFTFLEGSATAKRSAPSQS